MSNTLKFGAGLWATKKGSTLAYNDENGNYKPLPFNFERAGSATRVNKEGLIEVVSNNEPRIDFSNDAKGALLLEPSRTNINTNSESFNTYSLVGGSFISDNLISPNGFLTADSFVEDSNDSQHTIRKDIAVSAGNYTVSCFVKGADRFLSIYPQGVGVAYSVFDLNNGTITKTGGADYIDSKIENYGNGWYRCILTYSVIDGNSLVHLYLSNISSGTGAEAPIYIGNGSIMSFYGLQLEQGSYATSYIPTSGSIGTRDYDTMPTYLDLTHLNIGNSYTLFLDADLNVNDNNKVFGQITNSSALTSFTIRNNVGGIRLYNHIDANYPISGITSSNNKFVIRVDGNSYKVFVQGSSLSGTLTTQRDLGSLLFNGQNTELKINNFTINDTALSDAECEALTS